MGGIGGPELLIVFLVVLLVFGPKRIPEVARGLGKGLREIRRLSTELQREVNLADPREPGPSSPRRVPSEAVEEPPESRPGGSPPSVPPGAPGPGDTDPPDDPIEPTPRG